MPASGSEGRARAVSRETRAPCPWPPRGGRSPEAPTEGREDAPAEEGPHRPRRRPPPGRERARRSPWRSRAETQIPLLLKVLTYDRNFEKKAGKELAIGIVHDPADRDSAKATDEVGTTLFKFTSRTVKGLPMKYYTIEFTGVADLERFVKEKKISVLYIAPGNAKGLAAPAQGQRRPPPHHLDRRPRLRAARGGGGNRPRPGQAADPHQPRLGARARLRFRRQPPAHRHRAGAEVGARCASPPS